MYLLISRRPLSDAEKRLHEAAKSGKCDDIQVLAKDNINMSCPDPDDVRNILMHGICMWREAVCAWNAHQPTDLL